MFSFRRTLHPKSGFPDLAPPLFGTCVRNLAFWSGLNQDGTLNDIKWLQRTEYAVRQEMARVAGLQPAFHGEHKREGLAEAIMDRVNSDQLTSHQKTRLGEDYSKREDWFGEAVGQRTGLNRGTSFPNFVGDEVKRVAWEIALNGPAAHYVLEIKGGNAGHAIAVHAGSDGKVHLMNSNYGELKIRYSERIRRLLPASFAGV